jgi:hypothetical protein
MSKGNLNEFRSWLGSYTGPALASRFDVVISPQFSFSDIGNISDFTFQCDSAEIPGKSLATFDARTYGPSLKYPYQTVYNDLTLTFICMGNSALRAGPNMPSESDGNNGLWERIFFERWMNYINPQTTNLNYHYNLDYKDQYTGTIHIKHYDTDTELTSPEEGALRAGRGAGVARGSKVTKTVEIQDAFPIAINPITLNWADESIMRLSVTFTYRQYIIYGKEGKSIELPPPKGSTIGETILPLPANEALKIDARPGSRGRTFSVYPSPGTKN